MTVRKIVVLSLALGLVAAACGDATTTTTTTAPPRTTGAPLTTASGVPDDWPQKLVFGFIPSERAAELQRNIQPFMDRLAADLGIEVEGVVTADYTGLVVAMGTGDVDLGAFGPVGYIQAQEQFPNVRAFIQSIRFGAATYHGQWFTNDPSICDEPPQDGALENVDGDVVMVSPFEAVALQVGVAFDEVGDQIQDSQEDGTPIAFGQACMAGLDKVAGRKVAFTTPTSTSGAVFPQLQLINLGLDIEQDIEYSYLGSNDDTVAAVYAGDFDIGVSWDDARRNLRNEPGHADVGRKVIVFNITGEIPNDVVAIRDELPASLREAVYASIEAYLGTEEGEAVFDLIYGWTDIREAKEADFDIVREARDKLRTAGE